MTKYRNQTRAQLITLAQMLNDDITEYKTELRAQLALLERYRDIIQALEEELTRTFSHYTKLVDTRSMLPPSYAPEPDHDPPRYL